MCHTLAILPHETIRQIVSYTISSPAERQAILQLSHVSGRLRETVLDMSRLFTDADWNTWAYPLVEVWCQRAGTQPLKIFLCDLTIRRFREGSASKLRILLGLCSPRWGELSICVNRVRMEEQGVVDTVEGLLQGSAPLLHALTLCTEGWESTTATLNFKLDCRSTLRVQLLGIWALFSAPPTLVTDMTLQLHRPAEFPCLVDALRSCPLLQRLTLDFWHCTGGLIDIVPSEQSSLPSLVHLEFTGIWEGHAEPIKAFSRCFAIPNLNSITVSAYDPLGSTDLFRMLVRSHSQAIRYPFQQCLAGVLDSTNYFYPQLSLVFLQKRWGQTWFPQRATNDIPTTDGASPAL